MLKRALFCAVLAGGVVASSSALANGVYVSGSVGGIIPPFKQNTKTNVNIGGANQPADFVMNFKNGLDAEAALGYRLDLKNGSAIRVELAGQYAQYDVSDAELSFSNPVARISASGRGVTTGGLNIRQGQATIGVSYQLPRLVAGISPWIGVATGYVNQEESPGTMKLTDTVTIGSSTTTSTSTLTIPTDHGRQPIWVIQAGLAIPVTKKLSVVPAYRYTSTYDGVQHWQEGRIGLMYDF